MRHQRSDVRRTVLQNRENLIATLPPRRVWQTVKYLRMLGEIQDKNKDLSFEKEDIIVNGESSDHRHVKDSLTIIASHVFRADALARVIYKVFSLDYFLQQNPDYGLLKTLTLDEEGAKRIHQEMQLVFYKPGELKLVSPKSRIVNAKSNSAGSIRHCGKAVSAATAVH